MVMRFRRLIPSRSIRCWHGLWLYRTTFERLDEWRLSTHCCRLPTGYGWTALDRGCVKTPAFNLRVESSSHLVNLKTKSSGDGCSKRPIEKTVLRFLGSRTFSHGLDPKLPFAAHER